MKKRQLGKSNLYVSEIGLGAMSLGTNPIKSAAIISAALEEGINFIDTADLYDYGLNEELVGHAIKSRRKDIILATKVGNRWNDDKQGWRWDASKSYIFEAVKGSLRRLQTDYIDLYQLHGGTMEDNHDEVIEAFEELKREGLILNYGISSIRPNVIHSFSKKASLSSVMMQYSVLDRRPEEVMPVLDANGISMIARGPLAKGLLSEKLLDKASPSILEKGYLDYSFNDLKELLESLREKFAELNMNAVALHYVLSHPTVATVIPGASSIEQVRENARAVKAGHLTREEVDWIKDISKASVYLDHRI
ncbi:aldo/keto reductase [Peribacillus alkalitolerans]|uniref:aldo/keto reductase n=1 Tax=Peribacillus alkalitolerans TaxID=1550385 RepID=UPI0013D55D66|nr:aldo/keto reductase [Peribacillus alkalitolerans]